MDIQQSVLGYNIDDISLKSWSFINKMPYFNDILL